MINSSNLIKDPCQKIDPWCVDAYFELSLDQFDPTKLTLGNSWEDTTVDLTPAIKAGETITHLLLTDTALQFNREDYGRDGVEDKGIDCINGNDLSRIISMQLLKDVAQPPVLNDGDVYMYDANSKLFQTFNLKAYMAQTDAAIAALQQRLTLAEANISALTNRVTNLENTLAKPNGVPSNARVAWGTINNSYNSAPTTKGIWTHDVNTTVTGDERFD